VPLVVGARGSASDHGSADAQCLPWLWPPVSVLDPSGAAPWSPV